MALRRRDVLKMGAAGAVAAAGVTIPLGASVQTKSASRLPAGKLPKPFVARFTTPPVLRPKQGTTDEFKVYAREGSARILPTMDTRVWAYNGTFPGPTIKVDKGTAITLDVHNRLPETHPTVGHPFDISTHLHGSASLPQYDGYANDLTHPVHYVKRYHYPNFQNARTLWYHDHAVHNTAVNAYTGLAAQYHLHDDQERALLPQDEYDVPLTITDARFDAKGQLEYDDSGHSGLYGDVILVNGQPWPVMTVQPRIYRFRVLNASISRGLRLALSSGGPVTVVATDGGLMPFAQTVTSWRHGMAERYEVLIDFSQYAGRRVELRNLGVKNVVDYDHTGKVMAFDVVSADKATFDRTDPKAFTMPTVLYPDNPVMLLTEADAKRTRRLRLERSNGMWQINGKSWHDVVDSGFEYTIADPDLGDVEVWEIENRSGGWFHPTHIHLVDFKILSRNGKPPHPWEWGPKDVVYVGENETVRLVMQFGNKKEDLHPGELEERRGKYMVHCHNLPHEDHDMMTQFSVGLKDYPMDLNDPIRSAPCEDDPELPDL